MWTQILGFFLVQKTCKTLVFSARGRENMEKTLEICVDPNLSTQKHVKTWGNCATQKWWTQIWVESNGWTQIWVSTLLGHNWGNHKQIWGNILWHQLGAQMGPQLGPNGGHGGHQYIIGAAVPRPLDGDGEGEI